MHRSLRCLSCEAPAGETALACPRCGAPLEVEWEEEAGLEEREDLPGVFRWWPTLPLHDPSALVSLGEGNTPVVPLPRVARRLGLQEVYAKLESHNPTGSFKDRGMAVAVSWLVEHGVNRVVADSSGNAGASLAAYGARAGLQVHLFMPGSTSPAKLAQAQAHGAEVHLVDGPREVVARVAYEFSQEHGLFYLSHAWSPFFTEGTRTFAYELVRQVPHVAHLVLPVGNGTLLLGAWKAFRHLHHLGVKPRLPRLHAVQVDTFAPVASLLQGRTWSPRKGARTVAEGVAVARPPRGAQVVLAVRETGGLGVIVSEREVTAWQKFLAEREGIYCEPTSAVAFAGLSALAEARAILPEEPVVVPVTGTGLKVSPLAV